MKIAAMIKHASVDGDRKEEKIEKETAVISKLGRGITVRAAITSAHPASPRHLL